MLHNVALLLARSSPRFLNYKLLSHTHAHPPPLQVLFDQLTCQEQLTFFSAAKGVPQEELAEAVDAMIVMLGLTEKRHVR
jgi:hypothetical protein